MADLLPFDSALKKILAACQPLGAEQCLLSDALGRYLAEPVIAKLTQPPFDSSAMDGYAVRAAEIVPGKSLPVVGISQAGAGYSARLPAGACIRIFTGAPLPDGADAVIMQENATRTGDSVSFSQIPVSGLAIRRAGQDFKDGDQVLANGTELTPVAIALAAASNSASVNVRRQPRCVVLATGNELVMPGSAPGDHQIVSSNPYGLNGLITRAGGVFIDAGIATDDEQDLRKSLEQLLADEPDMLVTTGGASVGDHDLVHPVLKSLGVELDFWKIAMRPGKPLMFGRRGKTLVFGLPGNPVSAMVTATLLVAPAIRALSGAASPVPPSLYLPLASPLAANGPRRHFARARLISGNTGSQVELLAQTDSAHLTSLASADGLVVIPENSPELPAGTIVEFLPLCR